MGDGAEYIEISGRISSVVYSNEENGYTVLKLETGDGGLVTVVGTLPSAAPGEDMRAFGEWTRHPTHGEQFRCDYAERTLPSTAQAIYEYLAGRAIPGIGPATATLIVDAFGEKSLDVLESHPDKLAGIRGVSRKKAEEISARFRRQTGLRRLMEFLCANELRPILAVRLYRFYGEGAMELLRQDPYILALPHIGGAFSEADALALDMGMENDSPPRVRAAVVFELRHNSGNGHCFIPADKLIAATAQLIGVGEEAVGDALERLAQESIVVREPVAGCDACYLEPLHRAEEYSARRILELMGQTCPVPENIKGLIDGIEAELGIKYAPQQRRTIELAAESPVMALTGGPGTGKTTSVRAILAMYDAMGVKALCAAPTGRAAKRMAELTGREASTVHRLLGAAFAPEGDDVIFTKDESDPLDCGAVVLDECSMVDIILMSALLAALPPDCRLVLVGDADQLPSVGPGNVFLDVIRSGAVPTVRLEEIFRQSRGSRIVRNAHMINKGEHPDLGDNSGDFFFLRRAEADKLADTVVELCSRRLPQKMGIPSPDIQVLSPTRKGGSGTYALNRRLQEALNPPDKGKNEKIFGEVTFRSGDRVMQIRNNYDILWKKDGGESGAGIYNGDVGYITAIDQETETVSVDYDGRTAAYGFDMLIELEHAWAMTVHKSQGSEYRAVVLAIGEGAPMLYTRGVLYTAVTRARELLIAVGDPERAQRMIDNHRQSRRYSGLRARLASQEARGYPHG